VPPDQLPLVRAIRGEKIVDELIFGRNSQPRAGVWIRVNARLLKNSAGMVSGGIVIFHDFTQGRNALQSFELSPHPWYRASTLAVRRIPPTKPEETILISSSWWMVRF
jgi:hypothetical protein